MCVGDELTCIYANGSVLILMHNSRNRCEPLSQKELADSLHQRKCDDIADGG